MPRAKRLEFSKHAKLAIFRRAGGPECVRCEGCGMELRGKPFDYDHDLPCWLMEDIQSGLRGPLTAEDGKLLGRDCCHKPKTAGEASDRAHGKRIVEKAAGVKKKSFLPGGRQSQFKRKMNGQVVDRETGEPIGTR